jgi:hypothetical protein
MFGASKGTALLRYLLREVTKESQFRDALVQAANLPPPSHRFK